MSKDFNNSDLYRPTEEERQKLREEAKRLGINIGLRTNRTSEPKENRGRVSRLPEKDKAAKK